MRLSLASKVFLYHVTDQLQRAHDVFFKIHHGRALRQPRSQALSPFPPLWEEKERGPGNEVGIAFRDGDIGTNYPCVEIIVQASDLET